MNTLLKMMVRGFLLVSICVSAVAVAADIKSSEENKITIDVPVKLQEAKVVFNLDHVAMNGDMPIGMKYMELLDKKMKMDKTPGKIIGVFHGPAAYMTLNDESYNAYRKVTTGNPYKKVIENLVASGVQIEECAVSMKGNGWTNKDLLPVVKVNSGAVGRIIQLTQEGYVQIQP